MSVPAKGSSNDCLARITFKLVSKPKQKNEYLRKDEFPIALKPQIPKNETLTFPDTDFRNKFSTGTVVYASQNISRPRNKFILARAILSRLVKSKLGDGVTEDVSKVISLVWSNSKGVFQDYFDYLSFLETMWHEINYPLYRYHPKKSSSSPSPSDIESGRAGSPAYDSSIVFVNPDPFNSATSKESTKGLRGFNGVSNYTDICSSSYNAVEKVPETQKVQASADHYKGHTLRFSINKKKPQKKTIQKAKNKRPTKKERQLLETPFVFQTFKSPFYGDKAEDICLKK